MPDDPVWHSNALFWFALLAAVTVALVVLSLSHSNLLSRTMQLALLISVLLHMILSFCLTDRLLEITIDPSVKENQQKVVEPVPTIPDYVLPASNRPRQEQAFEKPVETDLAQASNAAANRDTEIDFEARRLTEPSLDPIQATPSPNPLTRRQPTPPRLAEAKSVLSRQQEMRARIESGEIRAPSERLGKSQPKPLEASVAAARRVEAKLPAIQRKPTFTDAATKAEVAALNPRPLRTTDQSSADATSPQQLAKQSAAARIAQSQAQDIASASLPTPDSPSSAAAPDLASPSLARTRTSLPKSLSSRRPQTTAIASSPVMPQRLSATSPARRQSLPLVAEPGTRGSLSRQPDVARELSGTEVSEEQWNDMAGEFSADRPTSANTAVDANQSATSVAKRMLSAPPARRAISAPVTSDNFGEFAARSDFGNAPRRMNEEDSAGAETDAPSPAALQRRRAVAQMSTEAAGEGELPAETNVGENQREAASGLATFPGPASGGLARAASRVPSRIRAAEGIGGLSTRASVSAGVPSRRASSQADISQDVSERFLQRSPRLAASVSGTARDIAPAFARRMARRAQPAPGDDGQPSPEVEATIELGLTYLAAIQLPDGRWTLQNTTVPGQEATDPEATIVADSAATGMALLAFLGAGYDHLDGEYREQIRSGLNALLANQKANGDLFAVQDNQPSSGLWFYSHGIASIALCEAYGMTGDRQLREPAQRALDFIISAQHPERGGWRYDPGRMSDLSVSGWQLMALRSGQLAGLTVPGDVIEKTSKLLDRAQASATDASAYCYNPWGNDTEAGRYGPQPNTVMTAVGLLMRLYTGWSRDNPDLHRGATLLLDRLPSMDQPPSFAGMNNPRRDTYYWYNATQVMYHMRGEHWRRWKNRLYPMLSKTQQHTGPFAGSWSPIEPVADRWGVTAGRLYLTAMNLLSLEVYHRHLPLFNEGLD